MPYYEVNHCFPLTPSQQDHLAAAITHIHCTLFTVPTLFAHVRFNDVSNHPVYLGGKRRRTNLIFANMRAGPGRTKEQVATLCTDIHNAWKAAIGLGGGDVVESKENKLNAIFVLGSITAGWEGGFMAAEAGKDKEWFVEHLPEMERMAKEGDEDAAAMVSEIQTREDFRKALK